MCSIWLGTAGSAYQHAVLVRHASQGGTLAAVAPSLGILPNAAYQVLPPMVTWLTHTTLYVTKKTKMPRPQSWHIHLPSCSTNIGEDVLLDLDSALTLDCLGSGTDHTLCYIDISDSNSRCSHSIVVSTTNGAADLTLERPLYSVSVG